MSNSLDEKIKKQAGIFDNALPPMGHFERFEQRLDRHEKSKHMHWRRWVVATAIAATVAVILMFQYSLPLRSVDLYPESVQEVAAYYSRQLEDEIDKIKEETNNITDLQAQKEVLDNIESIQANFQEWGTSLPKMPEEERIALIVLRYNAEVGSLQHIREILEHLPNHPQHKL